MDLLHTRSELLPGTVLNNRLIAGLLILAIWVRTPGGPPILKMILDSLDRLRYKGCMNRDKEHLINLIDECEQEVFELEQLHRENEDDEDLWIELGAAENQLAYYRSCLEDYEDTDVFA